MSRIMVFCNDLDYFLRHRLVVVERLSADGHDVVVVTGGRTGDRPKAGWTLLHMPIDRFSFRPVADVKILLKSLSLIRRFKPDAVHLITLKPAVFVGLAAVLARLLRFGPKRIVITIPGLGRLMSPSQRRSGAKAKISHRIVEWAIAFLSAQKSVHFTFETAHDRNLWLQKSLIKDRNSSVINGAGVDPLLFHPRSVDEDGDRLRVLFASRLLRAKGLEAFVAAAGYFQSSGDVEFVVAGMIEPDDPDGYAVAGLVGRPDLTFLGEVGDMPNLLRRSDIICLPTMYGEGIPRILIEAAASGLPSIATDISGCREIVVDGVTGTLVRNQPTAAMALEIIAAVQRYLAEPELRRAHGTAALAHFQSGGFTQDAVIADFVNLLTATARGPAE